MCFFSNSAQFERFGQFYVQEQDLMELTAPSTGFYATFFYRQMQS